MSGLQLQGISCVKKDRILFENVSAGIAGGELLHLTGPNGAGKTSLLRIIAGLSQAESGDVLWNNEPIAQCRDVFHEQLVYVGHKAGINGHLSAIENLQFWCDQRNSKPLEEIIRVLGIVGLVGVEDIPTKDMSAGQQRRVALARLWLSSGSLWILDEPFTSLDVKGIALLEELIVNHLSNNGLVVMTSHQAVSIAVQKTELHLEYRW